MSSAYLQSKLKTIIELPRFPPSANPESLLDRISIIQLIETSYYRGVINWQQVKLLQIWLETGEVLDRYALLAALEGISTIGKMNDCDFIRLNGGKGLSDEELAHKLLELSEALTDILDYKVVETQE